MNKSDWSWKVPAGIYILYKDFVFFFTVNLRPLLHDMNLCGRHSSHSAQWAALICSSFRFSWSQKKFLKLQSDMLRQLTDVFTSISCSCSWLVEYICCSPCSSSLFRSSRVFPSSAASCRSAGETEWRTTTASVLIVQPHRWTHGNGASCFIRFLEVGRNPVTHFVKICATGFVHLEELNI